MPNKLMIYIFDNTFEGLLTCIYDSYYDLRPYDIQPASCFQGNLFEKTREIVTDNIKAKAVTEGIQKRLGNRTYYCLYYAFLSEVKDIPMQTLQFLEKAFAGKTSLNHIQDKDSCSISRMAKKVSRQRHAYLGLMRFSELEGFLYGEFEPDYDILETLPPFFLERLPRERIIIHDRKRHKLALCARSGWEIHTEKSLQYSNSFSSSWQQDPFVNFWEVYFRHISISERKNLSCQKTHMPRKTWKYLPEKNRGLTIPGHKKSLRKK